jgi:glycosyltransferase involved in cell wall biosynthesis/signal peptidase I
MSMLNTSRRPIPKQVYRAAIDMWKRSGRQHRIPVIGCSMLPLMKEGDRVLIAHGHEGVRRGEVVVFQKWDKLVIHRVIGIHQRQPVPTFLTKGDNAPGFDPPLGANEVIGRVLAIERDNRYLRLDTIRWKILGWFISVNTLGWRKIDAWNRALWSRFPGNPFDGLTTASASKLHDALSFVRKAIIKIFCHWEKKQLSDSISVVDRKIIEPTATKPFAPESDRRSLKVVFAAQYLYPLIGGAEHTAHTILQKLAGCGYRVEAICCGKPTCFQQGAVAVRKVSTVQQLHRAVLESRPDVIITQLNYAPAAVMASKKLGVPVLLAVRSYEQVCPHPMTMINCNRRCASCRHWRKYSSFMRAQRYAIENADVVYCSSKYLANTIKTFYNREVFVSYTPMDYGPNYVSSKERPSPRRYITMCTFLPYKGFYTFAEIARHMPQEYFLVVGRGDPDIDLPPNLTCWPDTLPSIFYAATKIMVAPAIWPEPFGRTPLEAMANGIPVIASRIGGLPEAVGSAGVLVGDFRNYKVWVKHLCNLLENEQLYQYLSQKGYMHCRRFSCEEQFSQFEEILSRTVGYTSN